MIAKLALALSAFAVGVLLWGATHQSSTRTVTVVRSRPSDSMALTVRWTKTIEGGLASFGTDDVGEPSWELRFVHTKGFGGKAFVGYRLGREHLAGLTYDPPGPTQCVLAEPVLLTLHRPGTGDQREADEGVGMAITHPDGVEATRVPCSLG